MITKELRFSYQIPYRILNEAVKLAQNGEHSEIDAIDIAIEDFAKKMYGRPTNYKVYSIGVADNELFVVEFLVETVELSRSSKFIDFINMMTTSIMKLGIDDIDDTLKIQVDDLIAVCGQNIKVNRHFVVNFNGLPFSAYTHSGRFVSAVSLKIPQKANIPQKSIALLTELLAKNALYYYAVMLDTHHSAFTMDEFKRFLIKQKMLLLAENVLDAYTKKPTIEEYIKIFEKDIQISDIVIHGFSD